MKAVPQISRDDLIKHVLDLKAREEDLRRQVISLRLEITDMVNGHNLAMSAVQEQLKALAKRMNPKE